MFRPLSTSPTMFSVHLARTMPVALLSPPDFVAPELLNQFLLPHACHVWSRTPFSDFVVTSLVCQRTGSKLTRLL